jgi:uncharacterized protein (DUF2147 family)
VFCAAILLSGGTALAAAAAGVATTPVGSWLRGDGKTVFVIQNCPGGLCGHIAGFTLAHPNDPPPLDWRGQSMCGEQIISVTPEMGTRNAWHGTIINPRNGGVWQANLTLVNGTLQLRGYFGITLFGQTETWTPYTGQIGAGCVLTSGG